MATTKPNKKPPAGKPAPAKLAPRLTPASQKIVDRVKPEDVKHDLVKRLLRLETEVKGLKDSAKGSTDK